MRVGCVQMTSRADKTAAYGRSLIVDPVGFVAATAGDEETVTAADIDLPRLDAIRAALPALRHRRPEPHRWPTP